MNTGTKWTALVLALAVGVTTLGADRTARWQDRRGRLAKTAQDIRLSVAHGVNSDGNAQVIPLTDVSNMVMVRDGTALTPREGLEIRKHYNLTSGYGAGTMVILKESAPPDVELGNMFLQIDPSNGLQTVTDIEFMRDRTQLEGESLYAFLWMEAIGSTDLGDFASVAPVEVDFSFKVYRSGDMSQPIVVEPVVLQYQALQGGTTMAAIQAEIDAAAVITIPANSAGPITSPTYTVTVYTSPVVPTEEFSFRIGLRIVTGENTVIDPTRASIHYRGDVI
jgi:hypothetical protein